MSLPPPPPSSTVSNQRKARSTTTSSKIKAAEGRNTDNYCIECLKTTKTDDIQLWVPAMNAFVCLDCDPVKTTIIKQSAK